MVGSSRPPDRVDLIALRDAYVAARLTGNVDPEAAAGGWTSAKANFEAKHGPIQAFAFAEKLSGGLVSLDATSQSWLDPIPDSSYGPSVRLLDRIEALIDASQRQLIQGERTKVGRELAGVATDLFAYLDYLAGDARSGQDGLSPVDVDFLRFGLRLNDLEMRLRAAAATRAQFWYVQGMLSGVLGATVFGAVVGMTISMWPQHLVSLPSLVSALVAGAFGASVSVLSRMTRGGLTVDPEAGRGMLWFLGVVRPLVGAVFAVALFFAITAGVIPLRVPIDESANLAFYVTVGFLAGFSERYAQDMLLLAGRDRGAPAVQGTERAANSPPEGTGPGESTD
jgi:hypothetical protein